MLVAAPVTLLSGAALLLGILGMPGSSATRPSPRPSWSPRPRAGGGGQAGRLPLAGIALALTILAFTAAVATGWLAAKGITAIAARRSPTAGPRAAGAVLAAGLCGLVGVGVAALVRNQVAALVGVAVWVLLVEGLLMSLLHAPSSLAKWLPSAAAAALTNPGGGQLSRLAGTCCWPATRWRWRWPAPAWSSAADIT